MIFKELSILNQEDVEKLRKKMQDGEKSELTTRKDLYMEYSRHKDRLMIITIFNFMKTTKKTITLLYKIWDGRDDSEIDPELVEFRKTLLKGHNQVKMWMKERRSPWFLIENIPKVMPMIPESFKPKKKKKRKKKKMEKRMEQRLRFPRFVYSCRNMNTSERTEALKQFAEEHKSEGYDPFKPSSTMSLKNGIILILAMLPLIPILVILGLIFQK